MGAIVSKIAFQPPPWQYVAHMNQQLKRHPGYAEVETASGVRVPIVCCMPKSVRPGAPCLLFSHGNAEDLGESLPFLTACAERTGLPTMGFDYPGYGLASAAQPSERGCFEAAEAAWSHVRKSHPRVVLFGRSLGSGPACYMAEKAQRDGDDGLAGLVLLSPLCSGIATQLGSAARLLRGIDLMRNIDRLPQLRCPIVVVHGTADLVVPCSHGRQLHALSHNPHPPLWVQGAGHNDVPEEALFAHVRGFVESKVVR